MYIRFFWWLLPFSVYDCSTFTISTHTLCYTYTHTHNTHSHRIARILCMINIFVRETVANPKRNWRKYESHYLYLAKDDCESARRKAVDVQVFMTLASLNHDFFPYILGISPFIAQNAHQPPSLGSISLHSRHSFFLSSSAAFKFLFNTVSRLDDWKCFWYGKWKMHWK